MAAALGRAILEQLHRAPAYPDDSSAAEGVDWVQTHLSHVFLTGDRVYKFRKAVDLGFVCFATREQRNADCLREVELNRRLSPDVYLGVAPLLEQGERHWVGAISETLERGPGAPEYCVVMRRLPDGRDALSLVEQGALSPEMLDRVALCIADFHARQSLGTPAPFSADQWRRRILAPVEQCYEALDSSAPGVIPADRVAEALAAARDFADRREGRFENRRVTGRAVDAHGDLHLQHIWFDRDDAPPAIIDCLEFNRELREIDAASEVAFLAMDLDYRGEAGLAERFLRKYAAHTDDFDLYGVVDFFIAYRAAVRAKVAAIAMTDREIDSAQRERAGISAGHHLDLAMRALTGRPVGSLLMVCGVVGCGKSTVAAALADRVGGVVVASDRVRKAAAGLKPTDRVGSEVDEGLYAPERVDAVYGGMLERARPIVESGRVAILDATFARRAHRTAGIRWAASFGIAVQFVEVRCSAEVAIERLTRRKAAGRDPSDAGPDLYPTSVARFESVTAAEGQVHVVHTDDDDWLGSLAEIVGAFGQGAASSSRGNLPQFR
jgi:aminoglycoside phosphotransferase family enzyme/predicted kinase